MNVFLIISISTILVILILLLRYLIVSIEDLKAQIVAYKEQIIKGQSYTDDLLNDISKDVGFTRGDINSINDKIISTALIVNRIDDNIIPKTKIKAKNSSKKSE